MTDPSRRDQWGREHPGAQSYPVDPATPNPTQRLPATSQFGYDPGNYGSNAYDPYQGGPPGPPGGVPQDPPHPRGSRRWLWILAGVALLLVVGLLFGLIIDNSSRQATLVTPPQTPLEPAVTTPPTTTSTTPRTTTRTTSPTSTTSTTSTPGGTSTEGTHQVVYSVVGEGRAISILYLDSGGVLQTEFNVVLPWSKQVELTGNANLSASVSIVNVGRKITCSINVDGVETAKTSGTSLTLCNA